MKAITLALKSDGSAEMLFGPEVKVSEQRNAINGFRGKGLPKGAVRVEMWERVCIKAASPAPEQGEVKPAKERPPKADKAAKPAKEKAPKKSKTEPAE